MCEEIPHIGSWGRPRKEGRPIKTSSWYSIKPETRVHHNNTLCDTGDNIEPENRREGTGGKPLCHECAGLA
jgi:hypothetical protein